MGKKQQSETISKRQTRKEELRKKQRQQRIVTLSAVGIGALILLAVIIIPSILNSNTEDGGIVEVTPYTFEAIEGTRMGDPNAKVKIVVFSDFQCSSCKTYESDVEPQVIDEIINPGLAYYEFRQFPFMDDGSTIKGSDLAALASECAAEQNRFWDYKQLVFANQLGEFDQFSAENLKAFAETIKLDTESFDACLDSAKYQAKIDEDLKMGEESGVSGTPTMFINGIDVSPGLVPTFDKIIAIVQQELQKN